MNFDRLRHGTRLALSMLVLVFVASAPLLASAQGREASAAREGVGRSDALELGATHGCALRDDGRLACWGSNGSGQATPPAGKFIQVSSGTQHACGVRSDGSGACWGLDYLGSTDVPAGRYRQLDAGFHFTCGIRDAGSLSCFGNNGNGQGVPPAGHFIQVSTGYYHACAIRDDGTVACWGFDGTGATTAPAGLFIAVSAGSLHSCGVREDGSAACWGSNDVGQATAPAGRYVQINSFERGNCGLHDDGTTVCWGDAPAAPAGQFVETDVGEGFACGLRDDGAAECWGSNTGNQATPPAGSFGVGAISAGFFHSCGLRSDGSVGCWGRNANGETVPPAGSFVQVQAGYEYSCGLRSDGSLSCWGTGNAGQQHGQATPPAGAFSQVSTGVNHACAVGSGGALACWGSNGSGESVPPAGSFVQVSASSVSSCGLRADGMLACWGANGFGQSTPPAGSYVQLASGFDHHCALRTDGAVSCWGNNGNGQRDAPAGSFRQITANSYQSCGLRSDGTLACWGWNSNGQSVPPAGTFVQVSSGYEHGCAIREDGVRVCWGGNYYGQAPQPALQPATLPDTVFGQAYSASLSLVASGYTPPTPAFAVVAGSLPPGLSLATTGALSGAPNLAGNYTFTLEGEDGNGFVANREYTLLIDDTAPVIVPTVTGAQGDNDWYTGDVSISWSVTDAQSGIVSSSGCSASTLSTDSPGAGYTCTATSGGGTSTQTATIKRDTAAPDTALTATPANPSSSAQATFAFDGSDATSGVAGFECSLDGAAFAACASPLGFTGMAEGSHTFAARATDNAGNLDATPASHTWTIDTDDTPPVIVPVVVGTLGDNGWYTSDVSVSWSVSDGESAVSSTSGCNAVTLSTDTPGASYTCTASSIGGSASQTVTIKRDATAPVIAASATTAANAAGWYRSNVAVAFVCQDALSGIGACPSNQVLSMEGSAVSSTAVTVADQAGNTSAPSNLVAVKLDKTAPTLAPGVSPNPLLLNAATVAIANGGDALSGIGMQGCAALVTGTVGSRTVACSATDLAGNAATASAAYRVVYGFAGFAAPLQGAGSSWNGAQIRRSIPFGWRVFDANDNPVTTLSVVTITRTAIACPGTPQPIPLASHGGNDTTLRHLGAGHYRRDWIISASFRGTCARMRIDLGDGVAHEAMFKFQ